MEPLQALNRLGGAATTRQLLEAGCSPFAIRASVERGSISQVSRGRFALPGAAPEKIAAVRLGAGLTCVSALAEHGLPLRVPPDRPHLSVPRNFHPGSHDLPLARVHYQRARPAPGGVTPVAEALDTAGLCIDETWHLVAVDAALNRGLITMGDLVKFRLSPRERRDFLLAHADARAEAPGETIARLRLVKAGFAVRPQAYVEGAGHVDLEVEGLLILQVDGYEPHSGKKEFVRDREKSRAVIKAGRPQLSYAASEVLGYYSADIAGDVRRAIDEWNARDTSRVRPSGPRVLTLPRDQRTNRPS